LEADGRALLRNQCPVSSVIRYIGVGLVVEVSIDERNVSCALKEDGLPDGVCGD
jgi:hypothetical protein